MPLTDVLALLLGVAIGVLASVPVAVVIAMPGRQPDRRMCDLGATWQQPNIDAPGREIMVIDVSGREVLP